MTANPPPIDKQLLNIASELSRSRTWLVKQDVNLMRASLERAFELIDSTAQRAAEDKRHGLSRELLRVREFLGEFYLGANKDSETLNGAIRSLLDFTPENHELRLEL